MIVASVTLFGFMVYLYFAFLLITRKSSGHKTIAVIIILMAIVSFNYLNILSYGNLFKESSVEYDKISTSVGKEEYLKELIGKKVEFSMVVEDVIYDINLGYVATSTGLFGLDCKVAVRIPYEKSLFINVGDTLNVDGEIDVFIPSDGMKYKSVCYIDTAIN